MGLGSPARTRRGDATKERLNLKRTLQRIGAVLLARGDQGEGISSRQAIQRLGNAGDQSGVSYFCFPAQVMQSVRKRMDPFIQRISVEETEKRVEKSFCSHDQATGRFTLVVDLAQRKERSQQRGETLNGGIVAVGDGSVEIEEDGAYAARVEHLAFILGLWVS